MKRPHNALILGAVAALLLVTVAGAAWINRRETVVVPAGTALRVALDQGLSSTAHRSGDVFTATVLDAVVVDGRAAIPAGAGRLAGVAHLRLSLREVNIDGQSYALETAAVSRRGRDHKKRNWLWIGGGGATGTVLGALAGGGKGALIGGPAGAGAGLAVAAATGKQDIYLSPERVLLFRLTEPLEVQVN